MYKKIITNDLKPVTGDTITDEQLELLTKLRNTTINTFQYEFKKSIINNNNIDAKTVANNALTFALNYLTYDQNLIDIWKSELEDDLLDADIQMLNKTKSNQEFIKDLIMELQLCGFIDGKNGILQRFINRFKDQKCYEMICENAEVIPLTYIEAKQHFKEDINLDNYDLDDIAVISANLTTRSDADERYFNEYDSMSIVTYDDTLSLLETALHYFEMEADSE